MKLRVFGSSRLVICVILVWTGICGLGQAADERYELQRTVRYGYILKNETSRSLEHVDFQTYAPVSQTSTQCCCGDIDTSLPYELMTDELGNQILNFHFDRLPPHGSKVVQIKAQVVLSWTEVPLGPEKLGEFIGPEPYVEVDSSEIHNTAAKLKGTGPVDTARRIHDWIAGNIEYIGYTSDDRGALYALKNKRGDCTEFMYLFVALARASGIPAKGMGGYVVDRDTVLEPQRYHNWGEFYVDGVWRVADPQRRKFMEDETDYIAMRIIGGRNNGLPVKFHRFWCSSDEVSVRMNSE